MFWFVSLLNPDCTMPTELHARKNVSTFGIFGQGYTLSRCHYERVPNIQTTLVFNFNAINQNFGAKKNDNKLVSKLCPSIWSTIITPFFPIKTDKNTERKNYALSQLLSELWIWINLILLLERMFHLLWNDLMAIAFHSYRNRLDSFRYVTFRFV